MDRKITEDLCAQCANHIVIVTSLGQWGDTISWHECINQCEDIFGDGMKDKDY